MIMKNRLSEFYLDLNDKKDTAVFVKKVTQLWNCVNVKTKHGWVLPNEKKGNHSAIQMTRYLKRC